jgi:hypothetical protein
MTAPTRTAAHPGAPTTRSPRDVRRTRRLIAAVLLPVPPLAVAVLRLIWPGFSASDTAGGSPRPPGTPARRRPSSG